MYHDQLYYHAHLSDSHLQADPHNLHFHESAIADFFTSAQNVFSDPSLFADDLQNARLLVNEARLPPVFVSRLASQDRHQLLRRLTANCKGQVLYECIPKTLIVDVQNGLGNRLRVLASALEFAFNSRRLLILVWTPDAHINITASQLFDKSVLSNLIIINSAVVWPVDPNNIHHSLANGTLQPIPDTHISHASMTYVSLMEKDVSFSKPISLYLNDVPPSSHIYIRTAYLLQSRWNNTKYCLVNTFIQQLKPSPVVRRLVNRVEKQVGGPDAIRKMIGVHIRSRRIRDDNSAVDYRCEYSIVGAARTDSYRRMSAPKHFIPEMVAMRRNWPRIVDQSYTLVRLYQTSASNPNPMYVSNQSDRKRTQNNLTNSINGALDSDRDREPTHKRFDALPVDIDAPPRFYIATDSVASIASLRKSFDEKDLVLLPRHCDDRSADCILHAFADMIVLSRTAAMIQSGWSSFSEVAGRLRTRTPGLDPNKNEGYVIRSSGFDFGQPPIWSPICSFIEQSLVTLFHLPVRDQTKQAQRLQYCRKQKRPQIIE